MVATNEPFKHRESAVKEIHVIWMTTGLGCDGDSVSITAATQPSIEDLVMGNIPGLPKVHVHNPVIAYEVGDEFMKYWFDAAEGKLDPFVLVMEGSDSEREDQEGRLLGGFGTDPDTGQPITTNEWIDRLAPKALGDRRLRHLRHLRRHPRDGRQSDGLHGPAPIIWAGVGDRKPDCRS